MYSRKCYKIWAFRQVYYAKKPDSCVKHSHTMKSKLLTPVIEVPIYLATWPQYGRKISCGGNETLGVKKKANKLLRTHKEKIPEGFHHQQMGLLHDIERQSTMQVLKKQVVIQLKSSNQQQWEHKSVSYPYYIYHRIQSERKWYQWLDFQVLFCKKFSSKWHKFHILASNDGFSLLIASWGNQRFSQSEITASGYSLSSRFQVFWAIFYLYNKWLNI